MSEELDQKIWNFILKTVPQSSTLEHEQKIAALLKELLLEATKDCARVCPECKNGPDRIQHYESCTIYCSTCGGAGTVDHEGNSFEGYFG